MNKEDWLDYFEAVNGRKPSNREIVEALAAGEFQDDTVTDTSISSGKESATVADIRRKKEGAPSLAEERVLQEPVASSHMINKHRNQQIEGVKIKEKNYFAWFLEGLKRPTAETSNSQLVYGFITLVVAAIFLAAGLVNYINRVFSSIINITINGRSLKLNAPGAYSAVEDAIHVNFGLGKIIIVTFIVLIAYVILLTLPVATNKFVLKLKEPITDLLGKHLAYVPLLAIVNFLVLVVSFLTSNRLVISSRYFYQIISSLGEMESNPFNGLLSIAKLIKEVPALHSIKTVFIYIVVLCIISLAVLLLAYLKNIKISFGILNHFYVSLISLLVFILLIFILDKVLLTNLISGLDGFRDILSKLD